MGLMLVYGVMNGQFAVATVSAFATGLLNGVDGGVGSRGRRFLVICS